MQIKQVPEDFVVREIFNEKGKPGNEYLWFTLRKRNWDTIRAIKAISKRLGVSLKRFGYAGTKDRNAVTYQKVSVWHVSRSDLEKVRIKDIDILDISENGERINLGDHEGNEFEILVRDVKIDEKILKKNIARARKGIINYYDSQRFGSKRQVSHLVGREILRNNLREAVMIYLTLTSGEEPEETRKARIGLSRHGNFSRALKEFPGNLKYEIILLNHLARQPKDFAGALRDLPKKLRKLFVHAYQSYLWNMIAKEVKDDEIPLIGYETEVTNKKMIEILKKEDVRPEDFRCASMPELASEGSARQRIVIPEGLECRVSDGLLLKFRLGRGSYATVVAKEIVKGL